MSFVEGGLSDCATGSNVKLNHHYHSVSAVAASGSADFDGATASASASCSSSPSGASAVVVNRMPCGVISQPRLAAPGVMSLARSSKAVYTSSPGLSLALNSGGEGQGDGAAAGGVGGSGGGGSSSGAGAASFVGGSEYEQGKSRDEEYESRSGSDNVEGGASGDDQDADHRPRKKRYHRHTPQQIQELEALFKECPHPDEKQRADLSRRLNLETRQVKFWFQNRRTQMKTQLERHENSILRQENEKLRLENMSIKEAMRSPICSNCGGPAILGELSLEEQQLRIENARLKDELERLCVLTGKFFGRPIHPSISPPVAAAAAGAASHIAKSTLDLGVAMNPPLPSSSGQELMLTAAAAAAMPAAARVGLGIGVERSMMAELAVAAMDEFMKMAQAEEPLWLPSLDTGKDTLNYEDYMRQFPASITPKPIGLATEATRDTAMVMIRSLNLVDILMDVERWKEMFPCIISRAAVVEVISGGLGGTRNGALQLMYAELQVLSPLVPARELYFLRFCKQHAEGVWAVVDVSLDAMAASAAASTQTPQHQNQHLHLIKCRKFPSGCLIQELPRGSCKVTWVEHAEYDDREVHRLYRSLLSSGMAFGAQRWLATLQRQCDCLTVLVASRDSNNAGIPSPGGRRSMLKLAQRMTDNFCAGVSASTVHAWNKLSGNTDEDVRIMTRKSVDNPGEPPGVVLSAATSVWLPVSPHRLFQFLRDERLRSEWDILSNGGPMQEMTHIAKGQEPGNCVSLLRASGLNASHSSMLILQETCTDASGSLVVYAPVDIPAMQAVLTGGDPTYVALLPSGFAILPDGPDCRAGVAGAGGVSGEAGVGGSLLTVAFQILVNSLPTAKLSVESVETVNNLITCTVQKIKAALQCEDA